MCRRALSREAFGQPLARQGVVQQQIAESRLAIDQARLLVLHTAQLIDEVGAAGCPDRGRRDQGGGAADGVRGGGSGHPGARRSRASPTMSRSPRCTPGCARCGWPTDPTRCTSAPSRGRSSGATCKAGDGRHPALRLPLGARREAARRCLPAAAPCAGESASASPPAPPAPVTGERPLPACALPAARHRRRRRRAGTRTASLTPACWSRAARSCCSGRRPAEPARTRLSTTRSSALDRLLAQVVEAPHAAWPGRRHRAPPTAIDDVGCGQCAEGGAVAARCGSVVEQLFVLLQAEAAVDDDPAASERDTSQTRVQRPGPELRPAIGPGETGQHAEPRADGPSTSLRAR